MSSTKKIIFLKEVQYEIVSPNQIILNHKKLKEYILIDGISFELVVALINLKQVNYSEFVICYSDKFNKQKNIENKIKTLLRKLVSHSLVQIK